METNIFNYSALWHRLLPVYEPKEAQAVIRLVLEDLYGFTLTDLAMGNVEALPIKEQQRLDAIVARLRKGERYSIFLAKPASVAATSALLPPYSFHGPRRKSYVISSSRTQTSH